MSRIINEIKKLNDVLSLGPVSHEAIINAEEKLGLHFTKEYSEYTAAFGAVSVNGTEYTGAVDPVNLNVVDITKSARSITDNVPDDWYVVMDPHIDGIIIWQNKQGEIYQTAPNTKHKKIADSLADYIIANS